MDSLGLMLALLTSSLIPLSNLHMSSAELQTTNSMAFLHLEELSPPEDFRPSRLWKRAKLGANVIIGNLDTGVWPESASFNDHGYGPIPPKWRGICQNDTELPVSCNRKLIGARYFNKAYLASAKEKRIPVEDVATARDLNGHGTHTLSTAGGNRVKGANFFGVAYGTAKGSAPHARVASYKVCWEPLVKGGDPCLNDDILQGFDYAIRDGVQVLSVSLGQADPDGFSNDPIAIGAFHAVKNGIAVVAAAGNYGYEKEDGTVVHVAPWMLTVAASTIDRNFDAFLKLGNGSRVKGFSAYAHFEEKKMFPLIRGSDAKAADATKENAVKCRAGSLDSMKVKGKILVCQLGDWSPYEMVEEAIRAGAVGIIFYNDMERRDSIAAGNPNLLPSVILTHKDSKLVTDYLNSPGEPFGKIEAPKTVVGTKRAPRMARFSSKGPNKFVPTLLKPDITAPGVYILAAHSPRTPFKIMSGTSMATPHVAGIVALLKAVHPEWSQAALMSALMTTASVVDKRGERIKTETGEVATPFNFGSGHINPDSALEPGLVYDATATDYLNFMCAVGLNSTQLEKFNQSPYTCPESPSLDFNYPSIAAPNLRGSITLNRVLKNVGKEGTYTVRVLQPQGIKVKVHPPKLKFRKWEEKRFKITLTPLEGNKGEKEVFGEMTWVYEKYKVRSPIYASVAI